MDEPRAAKAAKKTGPDPLSWSMSDMSYMAQRNMLRFVSAHTLAVVECVTPHMGRVARAAVVELTDSRFGITAEPVSGCAWRPLVQEGLAGAGSAGWRWGTSMGCSSTLTAGRGVGVEERMVSWDIGQMLMSRRRS